MTKDNFRNEFNPYDPREIEKYFDPYVYHHLDELTLSGIGWTRLTIAFWDISKFSVLCNEISDMPVHLVSFLKEYFDEASKIITGRKGILDKFIGDGIMAYFGFQAKDQSAGPYNALMAALEFKESFNKIKERYTRFWLKEHGKEIEINLKCGLHTGYALFGLLETERRKQITVLGHNVNFASRLEHVAEDDEIIVSQELRNIARDNFNFEPKLQKEEIKSFEGVKSVFKLTGVNRASSKIPTITSYGINSLFKDSKKYLSGTCPKCMTSTRPYGLILPECPNCGFSFA